MNIAVAAPRQLEPSVGNLCAGITLSAAPNPTIYNLSAAGESIFFGSLDITPHSPASRPAFSSLHGGMEVAFGTFHFHLSTTGVLHLPEQIRSTPAEPASPSASLVPASSSYVGSSGEPEFTSATIFCADCDAHHVADPNDSVDHSDVNLVESVDTDSNDRGSCNSIAPDAFPMCDHPQQGNRKRER